MALASSLAKNKTTFATSSAVQDCALISLCVIIAPIISGSNAFGSVPMVIGVIMLPGQMALQRIPSFWTRSAVSFV